METIQAEQRHCDPNAAKTRQEKIYPPTLYRITQREVTGDTAIDPRQANESDPEPYVYASPNLREVLPYLARNGTRIVNVALPGSEDFITILPDRDDFLKNKKFGGTLCQFSGEGFEKSPRHPTQWVSRQGVTVSTKNVFSEINSMEEAMYFGLHILFTKKPFTPENYAFMDSITKAPDFPHNLPGLIADGTLIYENALHKDDPNVKISSFLTGEDTARPKKQPASPQKHKP